MILEDYPPYFYLVKIFDSCPAAIFVYLTIWRQRRGNYVVLSKDKITSGDYTSIPHFLEYLFLLKDKGILDIEETQKSYQAKLFADNLAVDHPLC